MMSASLGLALALLLIIEGLLPLLAPARWRAMFRRMADLSDGQIRFFGLIAIIAGVALALVLA